MSGRSVEALRNQGLRG